MHNKSPSALGPWSLFECPFNPSWLARYVIDFLLQCHSRGKQKPMFNNGKHCNLKSSGEKRMF